MEAPDTLIAELTYRCPLRCGYCSNPVSYHSQSLATDAWVNVLAEAEALGVLQLHLTGGEPLLREDLEELVAAARARDLYVNLITSGVPLTRARLSALASAGLDHVQLSIQAADASTSDAIAGTPSFAEKLAVAGWVKALGLALTINFVLHRRNIDDVDSMLTLAESLRADRIELANTQYLGWALLHRDALLPTETQLARARAALVSAKVRLAGRIDVVFVLPDYFAGRPRACMDGWARRYVVIAPDGRVLPCQAAHSIPGLEWERVGERPLADIWRDSPALSRFRGEDWMSEPCRSCEERTRDFGGCRCQAFHLTGDAALTDPACDRSPHHEKILLARGHAATTELRHRHLQLLDTILGGRRSAY